jgi:hypothetical protein
MEETYEKDGNKFTITIEPPQINFSQGNESMFDFVCRLKNLQGQEIYQGRISESLTPYFKRILQKEIPEVLRHSARMHADLYLQKLAVLASQSPR